MKSIHTNVQFEYGGYYSEEHEWIYSSCMYAIGFKSSSLEKITYSMLVDEIFNKVELDGARLKLKISYSLSKTRREAYIVNDADVLVFLTSLDTEGLKPVLHVELCNVSENNEKLVEEVSRAVERRSSVGVNYDICNAGMLTIYREGETSKQPIIEEVIENETIISEKDVAIERVSPADVDSPMDEGLDDVRDDVLRDDVELPLPLSRESQFITEWEDGMGIEVDQEFSSKEAVWDLINKASNKYCFNVKTVKSDPMRLMVKCSQASTGCDWYLRVAKIQKSDFWCVRVYRNMHKCSRSVQSTSYTRQRGTPRLVASVLHEDYPCQFDTPAPKNIMSIVQGRLGLSCSYSTALRGKKQHVKDVRGSPETSYKLLFSYLHMLKVVNPGTITSVELDEDKRFKFLFIALGASVEGFRAMRKVIVIDATFLKTVYGGMLVFATAQDPNHHHYPIAFGVIDSENHASWRWFFERLKTAIPDVPGLVFISDRHRSIIKAVLEVYPKAVHAHCIWHLSQTRQSWKCIQTNNKINQ